MKSTAPWFLARPGLAGLLLLLFLATPAGWSQPSPLGNNLRMAAAATRTQADIVTRAADNWSRRASSAGYGVNQFQQDYGNIQGQFQGLREQFNWVASLSRQLGRTRADNAVVGDLLVEFEYSNYQSMNGLQVPTRIVQRQAGMPTFDAAITMATANPGNLTELLTVPPPPGRAGGPGGPPPAAPPAAGAAPPVERLGEGVFKIGGNYTSLAVDMGDHILVVESGQSDARGLAVMAAAKQAIPGKPIRFVVNSHPHFDHASGLSAAAAEGATILTHRNNEPVLERLLAGPRTLTGDSLSKVTNRRSNVVEGVGDRDVRRGSNGKVVELIRVPNEHSDGMLVVYLPAEKVLWSADVTGVNPNPAQLATLKAVVETTGKLDYSNWIQAHPPNPDKPLTKAEVTAAAGTGTN